MFYKRLNTSNAATIAILLLAAASGLSGCVAAAVHTSTYAVKGAPRDELAPKAEAGDAGAQYELGKSYCCMGPGFDTQTATEWYCKAALQESADAMYELGRIYLGDVSRSVAPGQKLRALAAKKSPAHAHLWLSRAAEAGHADARLLLAKLDKDIGGVDLAAAERLAAEWPNVSCEYSDVFAD